MPPTPPETPKKHNGLFAKIIVGVIAVVATVLTAGALGAAAGLAVNSLQTLIAAGWGYAGTMAAGFAAGFVGNIASQGAATALKMQDGIDFKGALITGLATAATSGMGKMLSGSVAYQKLASNLQSKSISNVFSVPSAAEMMEQNAVSQALNTMVRRHQHFDWGDLAIAGAAGGIIGSNAGRKVSGVVKSIDKTGIVNSHVNALTTAGVQSAATGAKFSATQVVEDNMGHSMGNAVVNLEVNSGPEVVEEVYSAEDKSQEKFVLHDELYLSETALNLTHPERTTEQLYQHYLAQQLSGNEGYGDLVGYKGKELEPTISDLKLLTSPYQSNRVLTSTEKSLESMGLSWKGHYNEGQYDVDYDAFIVKHRGFAYKKNQIVNWSYYNKTPGSPISGDASRTLQIEAIDALIDASIKHRLNHRDTAYVLAIARHESGYNPYAAAGTTSASGLGQFIYKTGKKYGLDDTNRWDIKTQADALVSHFVDNKKRVEKKELPEPYIYQLHHDGSFGHSAGFYNSMKFVYPKIGGISEAIKKIF